MVAGIFGGAFLTLWPLVMGGQVETMEAGAAYINSGTV
jgi:hypothetical protein